MRDAVRKAWLGFNSHHEKVVYHMYPDIKNYITTGVGNLCDPVERAVVLPFRRPDGSLASKDEIALEWQALKNADLSQKGDLAAAKVTKLRLTLDDIRSMVDKRLDQNDAVLTAKYPDFQSWPADAQMAVHSMSWAMGPGFVFPRCDAALLAGDFAAAAPECKMSEAGNPGIIKRNANNKAMLETAARVVAEGLDPEQIWTPINTTEAIGAPPPPGPGVDPASVPGSGVSGASAGGAALAVLLSFLAMLGLRKRR